MRAPSSFQPILQRFLSNLSEFRPASSCITLTSHQCLAARRHQRKVCKRFYTTSKDGGEGSDVQSTNPSSSSPTHPSMSFPSSSAQLPKSVATIHVQFKHGFPTVRVPLPSLQEFCVFMLRPVSDTIGTFCESLQREDSGVRFVAVYNNDGERLAGNTQIQDLLRYGDFRLRVNDTVFDVSLPWDWRRQCEQMEICESPTDAHKALIASLHTIYHIDEFKLRRERLILGRLEQVKTELKPMEIVRKKIEEECNRRSRRFLWAGFIAMGLQTGVFARLTFYEYSWDIMEPVTYFATFSTVIASLAYYLITNQDFEYSLARRRIFSKDFYRRAAIHKFDIAKYNELTRLRLDLTRDLERLRDPLFQHLPASRLSSLESEGAKLWLKDTPPTDNHPS